MKPDPRAEVKRLLLAEIAELARLAERIEPGDFRHPAHCPVRGARRSVRRALRALRTIGPARAEVRE